MVIGLLEGGKYSDPARGVVKEFEDEFREMIGAEYCFATDHGHTALACAFYAAEVGPGDEFITPTVGYLGGYVGGLHMGARPVFADIDPKTLLIDPKDVERKITQRTRAINVIHMHGNVCDMDAFMDLGRRHDIVVIEDACHAHGAQWDGKKIGNVGDVACFSFQGGPNPGGKPVACGEGGMVLTNSRKLYERALIFGQLHRRGITDELTLPEYRMLDVEVLGWKFRPHPFAAGLAKVSLKSLDYRNEKMRENWARMAEALREIRGVEPAHHYEKATPAGFHNGHQILYHPDELGGLPGEKFGEAMRAEGAPLKGPQLRPRHPQLEHMRAIFTQGFDLWGHGRGPLGGEFMGLPPFEGYKEGDFPVAESLLEKVFITRSYVEPADGFIDQYVEAFRRVTAGYELLL